MTWEIYFPSLIISFLVCQRDSNSSISYRVIMKIKFLNVYKAPRIVHVLQWHYHHHHHHCHIY